MVAVEAALWNLNTNKNKNTKEHGRGTALGDQQGGEGKKAHVRSEVGMILFVILA